MFSEQLRGTLFFRLEKRIDTIVTWYRQEFADSAARLDAYYPWQDHGVDNNGIPVTWDRLPSMVCCLSVPHLLCLLFNSVCVCV
jgi:hypothetical protein